MSRLPQRPYVVVDSNRLRFPAVIDSLLEEYRRSGQGIMLPWTSTYELTKGTGNNFCASVRLIQEEPDAVSVARLSMMLVREHEQRFAISPTSVADAENTRRFRALLRDLRDGLLSEDEVRLGLVPIAKDAKALLDRHGYETLFRGIAATIDEGLPAELRKLMRQAFRFTAEERTLFIRELVAPLFTEEVLHDLLVRRVHVPFAKARKLARGPTFAVLVTVAPILLSLQWAVMSGIQNRAREDVENDGIDMEHAIIAVYGRNLISNDGGARAQYENLRAFVDARWP